MEGKTIEDEVPVLRSAPTLRSEFLMRLGGDFEGSQEVGETPLGTRRILYFKRGSFSGPRLRGEVLPGGGDWLLARRDGIAQLDIRITLRTDDDSLIYVDSRGMSDIAPAVRARIASGENVDPIEYYFRTVLFFEAASEKYRWLNRLVSVGVGQRTATGMVTDVFGLR